MKSFSRVERFPGLSGFPGVARFRRFACVAAAIVALLLMAPLHAQPPRNFLWKVTGPAGAAYLAGSVHLLTKDYYPLSPALDAAFKATPTCWSRRPISVRWRHPRRSSSC